VIEDTNHHSDGKNDVGDDEPLQQEGFVNECKARIGSR
jgi:hypothetical protein